MLNSSMPTADRISIPITSDECYDLYGIRMKGVAQLVSDIKYTHLASIFLSCVYMLGLYGFSAELSGVSRPKYWFAPYWSEDENAV